VCLISANRIKRSQTSNKWLFDNFFNWSSADITFKATPEVKVSGEMNINDNGIYFTKMKEDDFYKIVNYVYRHELDGKAATVIDYSNFVDCNVETYGKWTGGEGMKIKLKNDITIEDKASKPIEVTIYYGAFKTLFGSNKLSEKVSGIKAACTKSLEKLKEEARKIAEELEKAKAIQEAMAKDKEEQENQKKLQEIKDAEEKAKKAKELKDAFVKKMAENIKKIMEEKNKEIEKQLKENSIVQEWASNSPLVKVPCDKGYGSDFTITLTDFSTMDKKLKAKFGARFLIGHTDNNFYRNFNYINKSFTKATFSFNSNDSSHIKCTAKDAALVSTPEELSRNIYIYKPLFSCAEKVCGY